MYTVQCIYRQSVQSGWFDNDVAMFDKVGPLLHNAEKWRGAVCSVAGSGHWSLSTTPSWPSCQYCLSLCRHSFAKTPSPSSHTLTTHAFWKVPPSFRDWIVVKGWNTLSWKLQQAIGLFHWSVLIVLTYSLWVTLILWHLNDTWSFHQHCHKAKPLSFKGQPCQEFQFYGRLDIRQNSPRTPFAKSSALIGFPINLRFMLHNCWTILHASTVMNKLLQKHSFLMTSRKHNQLSHVLCNELVLFHRKLKEISPSIFDGSMRRKMLQRKWNKSQKRRCSVLWNTSDRLGAITFSVKDDSLQRDKISHVLFFFLYLHTLYFYTDIR